MLDEVTLHRIDDLRRKEGMSYSRACLEVMPDEFPKRGRFGRKGDRAAKRALQKCGLPKHIAGEVIHNGLDIKDAIVRAKREEEAKEKQRRRDRNRSIWNNHLAAAARQRLADFLAPWEVNKEIAGMLYDHLGKIKGRHLPVGDSSAEELATAVLAELAPDIPDPSSFDVEPAYPHVPPLDDRARERLMNLLCRFGGWKTFKRWAELLKEKGGRYFTRRDFERAKARRRREEKAPLMRQREEEMRRAAEEEARQKLRAFRCRLDDLGISDPVTQETYSHFVKMLPKDLQHIAKLPCAVFDSRNQPDWILEEPDPAVLEQSRSELSDEMLVQAWTDRWVTAGTVASELGISENRARELVQALDYREVDNPHYKTASPMRIVRMSRVKRFAEEHADMVRRWAEASARAKERYREKLQEQIDKIRAVPQEIAAKTDDPLPLLCFWLTLLNRAAKADNERLYELKDDVLRQVVPARRESCAVRFVRGGDKPQKVWLCDDCREQAREMGMHPLEYIDVCGPCENCEVEPAIPGYYDLYEIAFNFPGIGKFSYHVPWEIGKTYLPNPSSLPSRERDEEDGWVFGRPLNKIEREAFSVGEIVGNVKSALARCLSQKGGLSA